MSNLYNSLASVYEDMYQTFINYREEFDLYKNLLLKHHCRSMLEVGCGTGRLAAPFSTQGFYYVGLDGSVCPHSGVTTATAFKTFKFEKEKKQAQVNRVIKLINAATYH